MTRKPITSYVQLGKRYTNELKTFALSGGAFSRHRKTDISDVVGYILELSFGCQQTGLEIAARCYSHQKQKLSGRRITHVCRSSLCEARSKLSWEAMAFLLSQVNADEDPRCHWKGHVVRAIDGSRLTLPCSAEIKKHFPMAKVNPGHYPFGILLTAANVFTGQVSAAELDTYRASERDMLRNILGAFKVGDIALLDRGFDSSKLWHEFEECGQYFVARLKLGVIRQRLVARELLKSGRKSIVTKVVDGKGGETTVRLIRGKNDRRGRPFIIITNLIDERLYSWKKVLELYLMRWRVETIYSRLKSLMKLENFHSKKINGVLQEIWGSLVALSLVGKMIFEASLKSKLNLQIKTPNFKNALSLVRDLLPLFVHIRLAQAAVRKKLKALLEEIGSIVCYKQPGRKNPRVSWQPANSWNMQRGIGRNNSARTKYDRKMRKLDPNYRV